MDININAKIPAIEKLIDYTASGIGSVAGPLLARWRASQEGEAKLLSAKVEAESIKIITDAQLKARNSLTPENSSVVGELDITRTVKQRIKFQEEKRQRNIVSVVQKSADQLRDMEVTQHEPDLDWTARFFNEVQDVSSNQMQMLWARVLSGEVQRAGSTSIRTLSILKNLDQTTAKNFKRFCSLCMFLNEKGEIDPKGIVCDLGGSAGENALSPYGLDYLDINDLNASGLIISSYNSSAEIFLDSLVHDETDNSPMAPHFVYQNLPWILEFNKLDTTEKTVEITGIVPTRSGIELARVIEPESMDEYTQKLKDYFQKYGLEMKVTGTQNSN